MKAIVETPSAEPPPTEPAAATEPAAPAPAPAPAPLSSRPGILVLVAVALAAFAALLSVVGLLVASRTVAEARLAIGALHANPTVAAAAPAPAPSPVPSGNSTRPVTAAELNQAIAALRSDLARLRGAPGDQALRETLRSTQSEIANRITILGVKLERIERVLNSSRAAPRAGDRAPAS
jgi:hypothetical protein